MTKTKKLTQEEISIKDLNNQLEHIENIPLPTYLHNIGDKVTIGNVKDCVVIDVLENGKIYKIDYTEFNHNYGNPIRKEHTINYWSWLDIHPVVSENHNLIKNKDLFLNYGQRDIRDILIKKYHFGIEMEPEYQRNYVWELSDKQLLIDSIFNNIDTGKFVYIHLEWNDHPLHYGYEILDGKQRIKTICDFYEGRFPYNNLYYKDLSSGERDHFEDYRISIAEIRNVTRKQKLLYFLKLNRTGRVMSSDQLSKVENLLNEIKE
jgi:hypothetical protein